MDTIYWMYFWPAAGHLSVYCIFLETVCECGVHVQVHFQSTYVSKKFSSVKRSQYENSISCIVKSQTDNLCSMTENDLLQATLVPELHIL